jgi:rare lipoprotein A (peptidoglycan hydrolase)
MHCYQLVILSVPLAIVSGTVTSARVASAPVTASSMPSINSLSPLLTPAVHEVIASWYGRRFAGRLTTSGERFDPHRLTAASAIIPLGSVVKVENPENRRSVKVRINDCGPFVRGRSLDLSLGAAQKIGITRQGVARLKVTPINIPRNVDADRCVQ